MAGDIKIEDVFGLGKLVEVIGRGTALLYQPHHLKRMAHARAEQIRLSNEAAALNQFRIKSLTYEGDGMELLYDDTSKKNDTPISAELIQNTQKRFIQREIKRQLNIEATVHKAAQDFQDDEKVTSEDVSEEWIDRYFDSVQDVSNEELQKLWARVLSNEVKSPNSFSLRTLDILRNMSRLEAEVFSKVVKVTIKTFDGDRMLLQKPELMEQKYGIKYTDLLLLKDIGLIHSSDNLSLNIGEGQRKVPTIMFIGKMTMVIDREEDTPKISIQNWPLTSAGNDLSTLIEMEDDSYYNPILNELARRLRSVSGTRLLVNDYVPHGKAISFNFDSARVVEYKEEKQ